jgi:hypothetical protein
LDLFGKLSTVSAPNFEPYFPKNGPFCVNRPFSGSETLPTRFFTPKNPWVEYTFMAAMAMVREPLTKNEVQSLPEKLKL